MDIDVRFIILTGNQYTITCLLQKPCLGLILFKWFQTTMYMYINFELLIKNRPRCILLNQQNVCKIKKCFLEEGLSK